MKRIQDPLGWPELKSVWEEESRKKYLIGGHNLAKAPCGKAKEAFQAFSKAKKISTKYAVSMIFEFPNIITSLELNSISEYKNGVGSTAIDEIDR